MNNNQKEVVIVSAARTPIGKHGGYYNHLSAEDLAVLAVKEAIIRSGINLSAIRIDQVIAGMIYSDIVNAFNKIAEYSFAIIETEKELFDAISISSD